MLVWVHVCVYMLVWVHVCVCMLVWVPLCAWVRACLTWVQVCVCVPVYLGFVCVYLHVYLSLTIDRIEHTLGRIVIIRKRRTWDRVTAGFRKSCTNNTQQRLFYQKLMSIKRPANEHFTTPDKTFRPYHQLKSTSLVISALLIESCLLFCSALTDLISVLRTWCLWLMLIVHTLTPLYHMMHYLRLQVANTIMLNTPK